MMKTFRKNIVVGLIAAMFVVVATAGVAVATDSIVGTITEKGEVIVLDAADGTFILEGNDTAPEMVGKKVKVTGTITEKENVKVINVIAMEELAE